MVKGSPKTGEQINRIKEELGIQGRSQAWLAEKAGFNKNSIASWCNNILQPNLKDLSKIADCLNVSIKELVVGYNDLELKSFLEFLQKNYQIFQGFYFDKDVKPINSAVGGNHITHGEILEKYNQSQNESIL